MARSKTKATTPSSHPPNPCTLLALWPKTRSRSINSSTAPKHSTSSLHRTSLAQRNPSEYPLLAHQYWPLCLPSCHHTPPTPPRRPPRHHCSLPHTPTPTRRRAHHRSHRAIPTRTSPGGPSRSHTRAGTRLWTRNRSHHKASALARRRHRPPKPQHKHQQRRSQGETPSPIH